MRGETIVGTEISSKKIQLKLIFILPFTNLNSEICIPTCRAKRRFSKNPSFNSFGENLQSVNVNKNYNLS